jgi:hypothetical protein
MDSNSWFIDVENILYKYGLANAYFYLAEQPLKKEKWNKLIKERISKEWIKKNHPHNTIISWIKIFKLSGLLARENQPYPKD